MFLDVLSPATSHYKLLQCFGNCQCRALEMGKKFKASEKPVGKKLRHSEEYIPLKFCIIRLLVNELPAINCTYLQLFSQSAQHQALKRNNQNGNTEIVVCFRFLNIHVHSGVRTIKMTFSALLIFDDDHGVVMDGHPIFNQDGCPVV